jgi:hypothetical protein
MCVPSTEGCAYCSTPHPGRHGLQLGQGSERGVGRSQGADCGRPPRHPGTGGCDGRLAQDGTGCVTVGRTDGPGHGAGDGRRSGGLGLLYPEEEAAGPPAMGCALGSAQGPDPRIYTVQ